jgi:prevent-host-death family protein
LSVIEIELRRFGDKRLSSRKPVVETKKVSEARSQLGSLVDRVRRRETRVLLEKNGVPVAGIVSAKDLARLERQDEEREKAFEALGEVSKKFLDVPVEELERQVALALAEVRAERRAQREKSSVRTA